MVEQALLGKTAKIAGIIALGMALTFGGAIMAKQGGAGKSGKGGKAKEWCQDNPDKCKALKEKVKTTMQEVKTWCQQNPAKCQEKKEEMKQKRQELQQICQSNPDQCEQKIDEFKNQLMK